MIRVKGKPAILAAILTSLRDAILAAIPVSQRDAIQAAIQAAILTSQRDVYSSGTYHLHRSRE